MPSSLDELPAHVRLESHPTACNKAVAVNNISPGSVILEVPSMVVLLLPSGKGHRCDFCLSSEASGVRLSRCAGCASYWYCGAQCKCPLSMSFDNSPDHPQVKLCTGGHIRNIARDLLRSPHQPIFSALKSTKS